MTNPTIEKIKKLLALAGNNNNEAEAAQAAAMASTLMMRHGIEEDQLKDAVKPTIGTGARFDDQAAFHRVVAHAVAELMACSTYWYSEVKGVQFVGRPINVMAAEELFVYVVLQVESLYKRALPSGMSQRERAEYRKTFKLACSFRIRDRVREIIAHQDLGSDAPSNSRALVVQHRSVLMNEIAEYNAAASVRVSRPMTVRMRHAGAYQSGRAAGDQVELNRGVRN